MLAQAVTFLPYIREVRGSNPGRDTDYPDVFRGFPQYIHINHSGSGQYLNLIVQASALRWTLSLSPVGTDLPRNWGASHTTM
jgi:hypothetical protein